MTTFAQPIVGTPVFTSDNDKLGTVKEIEGRSFKIDASMKPDYWLNMDTVMTSTPERVTLNFPKDRLDTFKHDHATL